MTGRYDVSTQHVVALRTLMVVSMEMLSPASNIADAALVQVYERRFWTESFVQWSPRGNFLATMHRQGVAIWGGTEFRRIQRFSHPNVRPLSTAARLWLPKDHAHISLARNWRLS